MASYIGTLDSPSGSNHKGAKSLCEGCQEFPGQNYCDDCSQIFCKICSTAHGNISLTKHHKLVSWEEFRLAKQPEIDKYTTMFKDECESIEKALSLAKNEKWPTLFSESRVEVENIRDEIIAKVNNHHRYLIEQMEKADKSAMQQIDKQVNALKATKFSLEKKVGNLQKVSECGDILNLKSFLTELDNDATLQLKEMKESIAETESEGTFKEVSVVKGLDWNSKTSTRIEMVFGKDEKSKTISLPEVEGLNREEGYVDLLAKVRAYSESLGMEIQTQIEDLQHSVQQVKTHLLGKYHEVICLREENKNLTQWIGILEAGMKRTNSKNEKLKKKLEHTLTSKHHEAAGYDGGRNRPHGSGCGDMLDTDTDDSDP